MFSQYVEMCGLIRSPLRADRGVPTLFLHGRVPARRREEMVARFQDGGAPVFLPPQGRRRRPEPHPGQPRGPLRPLVEPLRSRTRRPTGPTGSGRTGRSRCTGWSPRARWKTASPRCWRPSVALLRRSWARARRGSPSCPMRSWRSWSSSRGRREEPATGGSPVGRRAAAAAASAWTWWGRPVTALEQRARLDPNRLPRGRSYARGGTVGELAIGPGEVRAGGPGPPRPALPGSGAGPGAGRRRVGPGPRRDRHPDRPRRGPARRGVAARGGRDDVRGAGTDLLPGPGELQPRCSRPDWADPCKHAAAVCYLVAGALDADPFSLLLLRGRRREEVLAALRLPRLRRGDRASRRPVPTAADPGVDAREAYRRHGAAARAAAAAAATGPAGGAAGRPVARRRPTAGGPGRATPTPQPAPSSWQLIRRRWPVARPRGRPGPPRRRGCWERDVAWPRWPPRPACLAGAAAAVTWQRAGRGGLDALRTTWAAGGHDLVEGGPRSTGSTAKMRCAPGATASTAGSSFGWAGWTVVLVCPLRQRLDPGRPRGAGAKCAVDYDTTG